MPPRPQSNRRLAVEGKDDKHSVIHLLERHGMNWDAKDANVPFIQVEESVEKALDALKSAPLDFERYGLVVDADAAPLDRWAQVRDRLRLHGIECPAEPDPLGTIVKGRRPDWRIGIWLMPDNREAGNLEDFLSKLVPAGDPCWPYAHNVTKTAQSEHGAPLPVKDLAKGCLYTWLAWQSEPGLPFGTALKAHMFSDDSPEALRFVRWFQKLFLDG